MSDQIPDWEVISKQGKKFTFWQMLFGFLLGEPPHSTFKFKVRQKSTGIIKTVTAYDEGELPERIAKGWFDFERIISEEAAEMILTGIRNGGEARTLALDSVEYIFRQRLQKGDIDPHELITNLRISYGRPAKQPCRNLQNGALHSCPSRRREEDHDLRGSLGPPRQWIARKLHDRRMNAHLKGHAGPSTILQIRK